MTTVTLRVPDSMAEHLTSAQMRSWLLDFLRRRPHSLHPKPEHWSLRRKFRIVRFSFLPPLPLYRLRFFLPWRLSQLESAMPDWFPYRAQAILRHSDYGVTANYYVKTVEQDVVEAMGHVENACNERAMEALAALNVAVVN